jgi:3-phosphoshikimate 1-carboxyvinyltransferase
MALSVAGLLAEGETSVHDTACIADSFPGFEETLRQLGGGIGLTDS